MQFLGLVLICVIPSFLVESVIWSNNFRLFQPHAQISNVVVNIAKSNTLASCAIQSGKDQNHLAFNFNPKTKVCQMVLRQQNFSSTTLSTGNNFNCYIQKDYNPCKPNPCLYRGVCQVTTFSLDYNCSCPFPMGGKNCEELKCDEICFASNTTAYFGYPSKSINWLVGYNKCVSQKMSMVMIKDNTTHQFIRSKFLKIYETKPTVQHTFWLGLNRTATTKQFKWVDGTQLGSFVGWWSGKPEADNCACIANTAKFSFNWDADPCDQYKGWSYFAFCQFPLPPAT